MAAWTHVREEAFRAKVWQLGREGWICFKEDGQTDSRTKEKDKRTVGWLAVQLRRAEKTGTGGIPFSFLVAAESCSSAPLLTPIVVDIDDLGLKHLNNKLTGCWEEITRPS